MFLTISIFEINMMHKSWGMTTITLARILVAFLQAFWSHFYGNIGRIFTGILDTFLQEFWSRFCRNFGRIFTGILVAFLQEFWSYFYMNFGRIFRGFFVAFLEDFWSHSYKIFGRICCTTLPRDALPLIQRILALWGLSTCRNFICLR